MAVPETEPLNPLEHPIEAARTAPYGVGGIAVIGAAASIMTVSAPEMTFSTEGIAFYTLSVAGIAANALNAAIQISWRNTSAQKLATEGYDEEHFSKTTDEWCARQRTKTLLRDTEHREAYDKLCEDRRGSAKFRWLPHF